MACGFFSERADSRFNCNGSCEGGEFLLHGFGGGFPAEGFAGAVVEELGDVAKIALGELAEVRAFRHELTQKFFGSFSRTSLAGRTRVACHFQTAGIGHLFL